MFWYSKNGLDETGLLRTQKHMLKSKGKKYSHFSLKDFAYLNLCVNIRNVNL